MSPAGPTVREPAWVTDLGAEVWASPTVWNASVLVVTADGGVHSLDSATGEVEWTVPLASSAHGSVAVAGDIGVVVDDAGVVTAVTATGDVAWSTTVGEAADRGTYDNYGSQPALEGDAVFVATLDGTVAALDVASGTVRWARDTEAPIQTGVEVADGRVYVSRMDDRDAAYDAATGDVIWEAHSLGESTTTPTVIASTLITGSRGARMFARDLETGETLWSASFGGSWVQSGAVEMTPGTFAIGSSDLGAVRAYDVDSGQMLWASPIGGWPWGIPAYSDGVVYATALRLDYQTPWEYALYALDASSGEVLWFASGGESLSWDPDGYAAYGAGAGPAVATTHVIAAYLDGTVRGYTR